MPTQASRQALEGLRDLSTLQWYVIPLLAMKTHRSKIMFVSTLYGLAVLANAIAMGVLGRRY